MRYLLIILTFISLSLCQFLPSDSELKNMTFTEKTLLYDSKKKLPVGTLLREYFIPTLGHAYVNDWKTGVIIKLTQTALFVKAYGAYQNSTKSYDWWLDNGSPGYVDDVNLSDGGYAKWISEQKYDYRLFGLFWLVSDIAQKIYLYKKTECYNKQLHNKIFGKKDNNFSFLVLPTSDGAYLNLSYKF